LAPVTIGTPMTLDWYVDADAPVPPPGAFGATYTQITQVVFTLGGYPFTWTPDLGTASSPRMQIVNGTPGGIFHTDFLYFGSQLTRPAGDPLDPFVNVTGLLGIDLSFTDPYAIWISDVSVPTQSYDFLSRQMTLGSVSLGSLADFSTTPLTVVPEPQEFALLLLAFLSLTLSRSLRQ
ncbi:MAG TPA: hypothetical protein VKF60_18360, partial [Myxococcota bacterium]|nr:hypothetical protein [Myxococcota bacterium]